MNKSNKGRYAQDREDAIRLLDWIRKEYSFKSDSKMAEAIDVCPTQISKYRNGYLLMGPLTLLSIHEFTELPLKQLLKIAQGVA